MNAHFRLRAEILWLKRANLLLVFVRYFIDETAFSFQAIVALAVSPFLLSSIALFHYLNDGLLSNRKKKKFRT